MERKSARDSNDRGGDRGSRILVVDDEEIIHDSLKRILGREGHRVDAVFDAADALAKLASDPYDLVITDLMMPEINGIQLLEQVRAAGSDVPVLLITGYPTIRTALQALKLGAVDYVSKPFTRSELLAPVKRTLRRVPEDSGAPPAEPVPEVSGPPPRSSARFRLREHSWAVLEEDGSLRIGIEQSFLDTIGAVRSLEAPDEGDVVEQGFVGFRLKTDSDEQHNVFAPFSGQVVAVHKEAVEDPSEVTADTWLIVVRPSRLEAELPLLLSTDG
jgi:CheY-like chemotaxis protein